MQDGFSNSEINKTYHCTRTSSNDKMSVGILKKFPDIFLDDSYIGQLYNDEFLLSIPSNVDPCGENGEFHTFVFGGPIFSYPIQFKKGDIVFREDRFYFVDLIP